MRPAKFEVTIKGKNNSENFLSAYGKLGVKLLNSLEEEARKDESQQDLSFVIPTMYVIRHSIEISLKILLEKLSGKWENTHVFSDLLILITPYIKDEDKGIYQSVLKISNWFIEKDDRGEYFRFTTDTSGNKTLKDTKLDLVELGILYDDFQRDYFGFIRKNWPDLVKAK